MVAVRQDAEHLVEHLRHIAVGKGDPVAAVALHGNIGEIDRIFDVAVVEKVDQLIGHHDGTVLFGLRGAGAEMRHGDHLVVADQLPDREVGHVAPHLARVQGLGDRRGIDQLFAGKIQQHRVLLEAVDHLAVDHVAGRLEHRQVQGDIVGARQQRLQVFHPLHLARQPPGRLDR